MGFDAIWTSPITKQINDPARAWHGYSQQDLYALNNNFGTAQDLKDLAAALHKRKMYLMVDIVVNHFGYDGSAAATEWGSMNPFDRQSDFHPVSFIEDWNNQTEVEKGWLGSDQYPLADVNTSCPSVRTKYISWIKEFVSNYSIDGLRIDTVKHVEKSFWADFQAAAGVYAVGEVADGDVRYTCPYQDHLDGILNYPMYYQLTQFFSNSSKGTTDLVMQMKDLNSQCKDPSLMASFSENHDQPRFANSTTDMALAMNVIAFTMLADGIPIVYAGQEQHLSGGNDPFNREATWLQGYRTDTRLYSLVSNLNRIRRHLISGSSGGNTTTPVAEVIYNDTNNLVLKKGQMVAVYNNRGSSTPAYTLALRDTGFNAGSSVTDLLSCRTTTVCGDGTLSVNVTGGLPLVFFPSAGLRGCGICGS